MLARRYHVYGIDPFDDLRRRGASFTPDVIFDVGANRGVTATAFGKLFPGARIFAFEPSRLNFAVLKRRAAANPALVPFQLALSSAPGSLTFVDDTADHTMSRFAIDGEAGGYAVDVARSTRSARRTASIASAISRSIPKAMIST